MALTRAKRVKPASVRCEHLAASKILKKFSILKKTLIQRKANVFETYICLIKFKINKYLSVSYILIANTHAYFSQ